MKTRKIELEDAKERNKKLKEVRVCLFWNSFLDSTNKNTNNQKKEYRQAKVARANYEEYEKLAALISKYPSRVETEGNTRPRGRSFPSFKPFFLPQETVAELERDIEALERTKKDLEAQISMRHGQFQHLLHALRSLSVVMAHEKKPAEERSTAPPPSAAATHVEEPFEDLGGAMEDGEL